MISRTERRHSGAGELPVRKHRPDHWILVLVLILMGIGLILIYSIGPALAAQGGNVSANYFVGRQFVDILIGLVAFFVAFKVRLTDWLKYQKPLLIISFLMILATLVMGGIGNRWIQIGFLSFQPVEFVKFIFMILGAFYLANFVKQHEHFSLKKMKIELAVVAAFAITIIFLQKDLGSTVVLLMMLFAMIFIAGIKMKGFIIVVLGVGFLITVAISSTPYRRERLLNFLQPERACSASGYQQCQALVGVGSGGLLGLGVGNSVQDFGYLPESTNDSIFAIYAEKFGFIGCVVLLSIYAALLFRIIRIIRYAPNRAYQLVAVSAFTWIAFQAAFNISAMIGLAPLKGIPLPFISYGGTSMIFTMAAVGIVFQISSVTNIRQNRKGFEDERSPYESHDDRRGNSRPRYTITRSSI